jgi:hypothetical protein
LSDEEKMRMRESEDSDAIVVWAGEREREKTCNTHDSQINSDFDYYEL